MRGTTITINGRLYDARTGLPVTEAGKHAKAAHAPAPESHTKVISDFGGINASQEATPKTASRPQPHVARVAKTAHSIHSAPQRSKTLHRAALQRPVATGTEKLAVKRSAAIQKFAPMAVVDDTHLHQKVDQPYQSPAQVVMPKAAPTQPPRQVQTPLKGSQLKEKLIQDSLEKASPNNTRPTRHHKTRRLPRLASIASGVASLVLLGGYLTYLNLPNLSLRVAASQASVAATYPTYQPSGYSFSGPVAYSPGEVRVNFKSNTNNYAYSVVQRASNWDSQAVRDNYIVKESKQYTTIQEGGITIYLVNNKAVWVNGGVLYSVEGNAPLSGEQIQKIASSTL